VGLWRSWERASMAWKRSTVRTRPGPPKFRTLAVHLKAARRGLIRTDFQSHDRAYEALRDCLPRSPMVHAVVAVWADSAPVAEAASVIAHLSALNRLQISPEPVVRMVQVSGKGDPKPTGQVEVFDLHDRAAFAFGNPNVADLKVFNEDFASVCGPPRASHLCVVAIAETAFL
jgi:hypothetical protein